MNFNFRFGKRNIPDEKKLETLDDDYTEEELKEISKQLRANLKIKDRTYLLKTYKQCFVASHAVDYMVSSGISPNRIEAVRLGRELQQSPALGQLWHHVVDEHDFDDKYFFFRFTTETVDDSHTNNEEIDLSSSRMNGNNKEHEKPPVKPKFDNEYERGTKLGSGAYAEVFIGTNKSTRKEYAVKHILDREKMILPGYRDMLLDEIYNLEALKEAPSIVRLEQFYDETPSCFIVMELLRGGELFQKLVKMKIFTEDEAMLSCICVLEALDYMHTRRIVHRDLKPENLMLANDDLRSVKVCDFGFSKIVKKKNALQTRCGTPGYMAPEILERWPAYDVKCDIWSYGVIMFFLLGGENPFDPPGATEKDCIELTYSGKFHFTPSRWKDMSFESKDLVACCLKVNPIRRIDAKTALQHDWFASLMNTSLKKPARRSTRISAVNLGAAIKEMRPRNKKRETITKGPKKERVDKLNQEFDKYLQHRRVDSLISLLSAGTGSNRGAGKDQRLIQQPDASDRSLPQSPSNSTSGDDGDGICGQQDIINMTFEEDSPTGRPFKEFYTLEEKLGYGSFGTVSRYQHKRTGYSFAVKEVSQVKMSDFQMQMLKEEILILKFLRGAPHIIRLFDVFEEWETTYLIMEEMKGGDLLDRLAEKSVYTEREARDLGRSLFEAVKYMHGKSIAHRDIKLENLLLVVSMVYRGKKANTFFNIVTSTKHWCMHPYLTYFVL